MGKEKDREKEIELLRQSVNNGKELIKGLYDDLFGSVLQGGRTDTPKSGTSGRKEEPAVSADDALLHAEEALKEAKELIGTDMSLFRRIDEQNKREAQSPGHAEVKKAEEEAAQKPEEPEKDPIEELDGLIGLSTIKHDVKELADFVKVQKLRREQGLKSVPVSLHLVFTGNPGTGKTTVARILARLYKKIGVLSKGQLVEVDRSGLVAGYVGQTALKTQEKIQEAMGGVLFIDEAYSLAKKDDTFGSEAIDTILKAMEDNRDDFVVIVAGYTGPMENFINSNPGLKSRFNKYFEFPDYTLDELDQMFQMNCRKYDYTTDEDVKRQVHAMIALRKLTRLENFANGREVRNLFEEIITNQARRVALLENPSHEDMMSIQLEDLLDSEDLKRNGSSEETEEEKGNRKEGAGPKEKGEAMEAEAAEEGRKSAAEPGADGREQTAAPANVEKNLAAASADGSKEPAVTSSAEEKIQETASLADEQEAAPEQPENDMTGEAE